MNAQQDPSLPPSGKSQGRVILVGAGPGDPKLITVAGLDALRQADVVVYDALANPRLLAEAKPGATLIDVGKRAKHHKMKQEDINDLLAAEAGKGRVVVRLKGGDPYLFGRGAEEAEHVARSGVAVTVLPGVTAGVAAPAAAGIPVTHRQIASTVTFVTGHEDPAKDQTSVDYRGLSLLIRAGGTACFYMGVGRIASIVEALTQHEVARDTPAAVVQWGTLPRQRSVRGTLATIASDLERAGLASPAIIVVGLTAGLDLPGLDFFTARPLFGQRIIVTRTRDQASQLREQLEALGADVLEAPTIEIRPPDSYRQVDAAINAIHADYNWLMLTSPNGVAALRERLDALNLDARCFAGLHIAAVGDATQDALRRELGLCADFVPEHFSAEAMAAELVEQHDLRDQRVLLLRADIARPQLVDLLKDAGAAVTDLSIYETHRVAKLSDEVAEALREASVDWVTFTSSSTARYFFELADEASLDVERVSLASIGPITTQTLRDLKRPPDVEASPHNIAGLIDALVRGAAG